MDTEKYKPAFAGEHWTERDLHYLEPFASNPKGLVSTLSNLPPELVGALSSRASRAQGSLLRIFLKEYIYPILDGEDRALAEELDAVVDFFREKGFKNILNNQRAQAFYAKWLSQYGDDSIAQMTGTHLVFWGISQVAMKNMEDRRIGLEPIEKSTRYVNFGEKIDGKYLYYTPVPDLQSAGLLEEYTGVMDDLFDTYVALLPKLLEWLKKNYDDKESVLEKKAFDTLRGLLPMATLGQVAFRGNAQAFEYLMNRTMRHPLGELRWIAEAMKKELDKEIPSLFLRLNDPQSEFYQEEVSKRSERVRSMSSVSETHHIEQGEKPAVRLVEYDTHAEDSILTGILYPENHMRWDSVLSRVKEMKMNEKKNVIAAYIGKRNARWQKVGRAFENSFMRFEIEMNIGAYRDLQRHRMMTQERQRFTTHHGYDVPKELMDAGLSQPFVAALEKTKALFGKLEAIHPDLAQYVVPLAYRVRFYQWQNVRQFFWETELRTISQGHPDYRWIEHEKYRLAKEAFPLISGFVLADMNDYKVARRGTEEKIAAKERDIVEKLKGRGTV